jgi:hypothetical protein
MEPRGLKGIIRNGRPKGVVWHQRRLWPAAPTAPVFDGGQQVVQDSPYARMVGFALASALCGRSGRRAMQDFVKHFVRGRDGTWTCTKAAQYRVELGILEVKPGDRFRPGDIVMGVEVVALLDRAAPSETDTV